MKGAATTGDNFRSPFHASTVRASDGKPDVMYRSRKNPLWVMSRL